MATPAALGVPRILVTSAAATDAAAIDRFMRDLSKASRRSRFFAAMSDRAVTAEARRELAPGANVSVVARDRDSARIVGHAIALADGAGRAEVGLAVADDYQHHGIGSVMVDQLVHEARARGIELLWADVLADNGRMLDIFARAGFSLSHDLHEPAVRVALTL